MKLKRITQYLFLSCLLMCNGLLIAAEAIQDEWDNVARVVIIGDIHGDYDNYFAVLREAGLVNRRGNWTGDETHLVQLGDVPDRGPDTARIIEHLQKLERQAQRDDGMVHVLIGNHEFMNVIGDLRYVHPGEYEAMESRNASRLRDAYYQQTVQAIEARNAALLESQDETTEAPTIIDEAYKTRWYEQFPLGYVEHRLAWQAGGELNDWVSTHNSVIRINDMLFMHAGLGPEMIATPIREINAQIRREILGDIDMENNLGEAEFGPLWYRGLALAPESTEKPHVEALLAAYGVNTVVVGHTPGLGVITPRFGGSVVVADTGISAYYGGFKASMLVENGERFALQLNAKIPLPTNDDAIIPYFQATAELMPENSRLQSYLENLINPPVEPVLDDSVNTETIDGVSAEFPD